MDHIYDQFTKFPVGQASGLLGITPFRSRSARMETNSCARLIHPLFPRPFAQFLDTRPPYHPSDKPIASRLPQVPPNHSITPRSPYPHLPTRPGLEPLQLALRSRSQSLRSVPLRLYFTLRAKRRTLSPTTDTFPPPAERTGYCEYHSFFTLFLYIPAEDCYANVFMEF